MATLLLPETCARPVRPSVTVMVAILCSPIRAADGTLRVFRQDVATEGPLTTVIPQRLRDAQVSVNGGPVAPEDWGTWELLPGDEVLIIPRWGDPITPWLIPLVIGLVVSIATTALSYVLFPPPKAHNIQHTPEEPTFSFEGIRTTLGPGAVVPVIYGVQRTGGQLLSSRVDQDLTVLDDGIQSRRITASAAPATLSLLLALGEGPVEDVRVGTIQINGQPLANFPGVQVYTALGTPDQPPFDVFGETTNSFSSGATLTDPGSTFYTTTAPIDAFILNIVFNQGLYRLNDKGEKIDNLVDLQYRFKVAGTEAWSPWSQYDVVAQRTAPVRFGIRRENIALAVYDIELNLEHVQQTNNAQWAVTLESVTEVQRAIQTYPNTALLGLRALATDTLQGALPNVTVEVAGRKVRVDTFTALPTWSNNPAWCTMDFLTNTRYGLGVPDSQIDLGSFSAWSAYCSELMAGESRHTLNYALDRDVRAQQALLEMAGSARTLLFKSEGVWTARPTRSTAPVLLLSWANCTDLTLTYTRDPDRVNVIEARFSNEDEDFAQDVLTWPTIDNWPPEVRKTSLELRGVTKPSRVMRAMQFELNRRRYENVALDVTCNLEAVPLQPHDIFRFSHPLPGWGVSGRVQTGSTISRLYLDREVIFDGPRPYIVYVRYQDGTTEIKPVGYFGDGAVSHIDVAELLSQVPTPRTTLYAFGYQVGPVDTAVKLFRVVQIQRTSDNRVRIQAMIHNPSIYDEPLGEPLPVTTLLFNPLGPPPALTNLIASEVIRIQASGASLRVVNLSWAVGHLGTGLAPYGGALILRRTVQHSSNAGSAEFGASSTSELQAATDTNVNYAPLHQVSGHVLDYDDYTIISGVTYVYRVVPMSSRGVPNYPGSREVTIHIAGPTSPDFFPGTTTGLRLKGKPVGDLIWEGRDAHFEWDPMNSTGLFTNTFFIVDYVVEIWAPGQQYLMRRTAVPSRGHGVTMEWTYTLEQNAEDQVAAGQPGARRDFSIYVWGRSNTGRLSVNPAHITVTNPPPDMGDMVPILTPVINGALIEFDQFVEPRDFDHYAVFVDPFSPPTHVYEHVAIGSHGQGLAIRVFKIDGLITGQHYWTYVLPFDTFGPGIPTGIVEFVAGGITAESIDATPPATPTGLFLTTGTTLSNDGTIMPWVQANWAPSPEPDVARYEVHFRIEGQLVPTSFTVAHPTTSVRLENVAGNQTIYAKVLASDKFSNHSPFTEEVSTLTSRDTVPPGMPGSATATGHFQSVNLQWFPPADADYAGGQVYRNTVDDVTTAEFRGEGFSDYLDRGVLSTQGFYYWVRSRDTSGNLSAFSPTLAAIALQTNGIDIGDATIGTAKITDLEVTKLSAGTLRVLTQLGVGASVYLDGTNAQIAVFDATTLRVLLGKLGSLSTQYGLQIFNELGQLMWNFATGATPAGIQDGAITATKIQAGSITATHLVADQVVITSFAQIAAAQIVNGHIVNMSAEKILTGILNAQLQLGVGEDVYIDGPGARLLFFDKQSPRQLRILLGKLGGASADYGLSMWNAAGGLMWDFNSGASSLGLQDLSVTNAKIHSLTADKIVASAITALLRIGVGANVFLDGPNQALSVLDGAGNLRVLLGKVGGAITDYGLYIFNAAGQIMWQFDSGANTEGITPFAVTVSLAFAANVNLALAAAGEVEAASLTFTMLAGETVWLHGIVEGQTTASDDILGLRLREDSLSGGIHHETHLQGGGGITGALAVQAVWTAPGSGTKTFVLSFTRVAGSGTVNVRNRYFVALRRRR